MTDDPIGSKKFLTQVGGINLDPVDKQLGLRIQPKVKKGGVEYSEFDLSGVKDDGLGFTGTKFDMVSGTYTTILMINSRDRDSQVYPQPTFFTIRLPRTYRNIASFQITQMKLLSSFFYFRNDKANTTMDVLEQGRTITDNGTTVDNIVTVRIREGTYNIDSLLSELQTQMNRTPLFFYYPNGFSDFITQFTAAGDLSVNFNQPGDNFFNTLTDQFIQNPTTEQIVTTYFATRYAGLSIYTLAQVKVAYYYPVLYEMILDPEFANLLNLTLSPTGPQLLPGETVKSRIVYTFQGLNDGVIQEIIDNNLKILTKPGISILDNYRTLNTFVYSLVNEYSCSYEQNNNRVIISTSRLNTSLFNLLNQQAALSLVDTLNSYGLTLAQYSNLLLSNTLYTAVFTNMYNFMQSNFATNFAVDFGTYTPTFFTNVSNAPYLQNGIGAIGVATGYSLAVLSSGVEPINSSTQNLKSFPPYWPQITSTPSSDTSGNVLFVGSGLQNRVQDISANFMNVVYNTLGGNIQTNQKLIDNSGNIYINPTFGAGDCVTPILNSQYTVFRFRSYVRQTLQVETLPLPYYYRFPSVNLSNFENPIPSYFDASYSYVNSPYLTRTDISSVSITFPQSYTTAYPAAKDYEFTVNSSRRFYTFVAPQPKARTGANPLLTDASGYKYPLTVSVVANSILGTPIVSPSVMNAYFYHDQGAFYADVSANRNENPYHYKEFVQLATDVSSVSFTTNVFSGNQYYMIVRSSNVSFQDTRLKVLAYYPNQYSTPIARYQFQQNIDPFSKPTTSFPVTSDVSYNQIYAYQYDRDFIRLPTASNLMGADPSSQGFNEFLPVSEVAIGYDVSGVSTDLTDYKGYNSNILGNVPFAGIRADPVSRYNFQVLSPYNTQTSNYFYSGSSNSLLSPIVNNPYVPKKVNNRQFKIVNWYDTQYIAPQVNQPGIPNSNFAAKSSLVDASYGSLTGYVYDASNNGLSFDQGVVGFSFLPAEGIWDVDEIVFKSAYMERPLLAGNYTDPNKKIKYLGVYPTGSVSGYNYADISLNFAVSKLDLSGVFPYTPDVRSLYNTFDNTGGTYFKYVRDSNFSSASSNRIAGYSPATTYLFDINSYYSVLAFDASKNIIPFYTLMGSYIPYPPVSYPENSSTIMAADLPGNPPTITPNRKEYYYPKTLASRNPVYYPTGSYNANYWPPDSNIYQSKYELSMPIKTTILHTQAAATPISFSNGLYYYPTDPSVTSSLTPPGCNLPSQVGQSGGFSMGGYVAFSKGPYFILLNNTLLSPLPFTPAVPPVQYLVTSNRDISYDIQGTASRTWTAGSANTGPANIEDIFTSGQKQIVNFAWNNSGTDDTDGIYVLRQFGRVGSLGILFSVDSVTLNPKFGTMTTNSVFTFTVDDTIYNGTPTGAGQFLQSNDVLANINYGKFYITDTNTCFFQFTINNSINTANSYFGVYNSNTNTVTQALEPAVGLGTAATSTPYPFARSRPYWFDSYRTGSSSNLSISYLDWTVDRYGTFYLLYPGNDVPVTSYGFIDVYATSNGNFVAPTYYTINLNPSVNTSIRQLYGLAPFSQIRVDDNLNLYFTMSVQHGPLYGNLSNTLVTEQNSANLWGNYAGLSSSNIYQTQLDAGFTVGVGGTLVPPGGLGEQTTISPIFQISRQQLATTSNDSVIGGTGIPLATSFMYVGNQKTIGSQTPLFFQMANTQAFFYSFFGATIFIPTSTDSYDISGSYQIVFTVPNFPAGPFGGKWPVTLYPAMTDTQIAAAFNAAIFAVSRQTANLFIQKYDRTIATQIIDGTTYPNCGTILWVLAVNSFYATGFRVESFNLYNGRTPSQLPQGAAQDSIINQLVNVVFPPAFGNSGFGVDTLTPAINNSWQVFYPTTKIVLKKLQNGFTPITDTTDLTTYPSYEHTAMFYYDNYRDLSNDIFNKFGQEKNTRFKAYDISSGYFFNSYIYNIQLQPFKGNSLDISSNTGYNYLAVRGYSPCETFNCLTRFYLPGRYDFGFISLKDLSNETQSVLVDLSGSSLVNPTYAFVLNQFNNGFKGSFRFGSNAVPGFSGSNYTFNGFGSFLNQYIRNYNSGTSNANLLAAITSNVNSNVTNYIQTYLSAILPSYVLSRERFTDPLLFSLLLKTGLSDARKDLEYEWGLGWNLGFPKADTPYDTIQRATSFFKILDDYIYLRLNQEFWMNRLDSSGKENLSITHESQGQTNQFAAKLLLANFGGYAQTMIQNPITFNPVLTSIDRLSFEWVDLAGVRINNFDCEWNAAVQIVEQVTQATPNSTIPRAEARK